LFEQQKRTAKGKLLNTRSTMIDSKTTKTCASPVTHGKGCCCKRYNKFLKRETEAAHDTELATLKEKLLQLEVAI
jgi:hypothetical protein